MREVNPWGREKRWEGKVLGEVSPGKCENPSGSITTGLASQCRRMEPKFRRGRNVSQLVPNAVTSVAAGFESRTEQVHVRPL